MFNNEIFEELLPVFEEKKMFFFIFFE